MPPPNFFTRARRIFQNTDHPPQPDQPHLSPTNSPQSSQYETDGSSYEMLVVDTPEQLPQSKQQQHSKETHNNISKQQPENRHQQQQQRTPPPSAPPEPQTPSQKVPFALRRIDATPTNLPDTPGYNLRSRTRSQAPPTPQRPLAPSRSRRRELRQAPSAHTTSGIAGRPPIVSRRQIDESSYVTLRAMCRSFGLPTSGTKAELRVRAIEKFERRRVLDEQTQPLDDEQKLKEDSQDPLMLAKPFRNHEDVKHAEEKTPDQVQEPLLGTEGARPDLGENAEQTSGKQITTSTVRPSAQAKQLPVEATIPAKSDEPSVHAKSDTVDNDSHAVGVNPAERSTANLPPTAQQEVERVAQPTVSSTGVAVNSPDSPRPPAPHPTPRQTEPPFSFPSSRGTDGPTESVDARGGDIDVVRIFQDLASGRRKLSRAEYEAALKALNDNAPDRPQVMQIPISAARVSLSTLPITPVLNFKRPPNQGSAAGIGGAPPQRRSPFLPDTPGGTTSIAIQNCATLPGQRVANQDAAEKRDQNKTRKPKQAMTPPSNQITRRASKEEEAVPAAGDNFGSVEKPPTYDLVGDKVNSTLDQGIQGRKLTAVDSSEQRVLETPLIPESTRNVSCRNLQPGVISPPKLAELNQNSPSAFFERAQPGPRKGNSVNVPESQTPVQNAEPVPVAVPQGNGALQAAREKQRTEEHEYCEERRSGFATPRELVRRFNRFGNARRSSSGVPLFYSARGPSTAGRSISKTRPSSRAREAQDTVRRMDGLHNLSGHASFRVKRSLSASAGGLLVDLRRTGGMTGRQIDRMDLRGSFQAEVARKPPPMAASALKILKELERIQEENRADMGRKRMVSPPPLPPSVVKKARRSGHFALRDSHADLQQSDGFQTRGQALGTDPSCSPCALDRSSGLNAKGASTLFGRQTPKIPLVAYGLGKRNSKRSRSNRLSPSVQSAVESQMERKIVKENESKPHAKSIRRTKRRRQREDSEDEVEEASELISRKKADDMTTDAMVTGVPFTFDTPNPEEGKFTMNTEAAQLNMSALPSSYNLVKPGAVASDGVPRSLPPARDHIVSTGLVNNEVEAKTKATASSRNGQSDRDRPDLRTKEVARSFKEISPTGKGLFAVERHGKAAFFTTGNPEEQQKLSENTAEPDRFTGVIEKEPNRRQKQELSTQVSFRRDDTVDNSKKIGETKEQENVMPGNQRVVLSHLSQKEGSLDAQVAQVAQQPTEVASPFPFGSSTAPAGKADSLLGTNSSYPAAPFARPTKSFPGNKPEDGKEAPLKQQGDISPPSNPLSSLGSLKKKDGDIGFVSAPSIPSTESGGPSQLGFGTVPFTLKPNQKDIRSDLQPKETSGGAAKKSETGEKEYVPTTPSISRPMSFPATDAAKQSTTLDVLTSKEDATADLAPVDTAKPLEDRPSMCATPSSRPMPVAQMQSNELPNSKAPAPFSSNNEPFTVSKPVLPSNIDAMATSTTPPSAAFTNMEKPAVSKGPQLDNMAPPSEEHPKPFTSGPFPQLTAAESQPSGTFSFAATQKTTEPAPDGPFASSQFKLPFSSAGSGSMFVFGSSATNAAEVKPAPSIAAKGASAAPDATKSNPFAQPSSAMAFSSQPISESGGLSKASEPTFGTSSGSDLSTTFGTPATNPASGLGGSFGSSQGSLFNPGAGTTLGAASTTQAFGGTAESKPPPFGSVNIQPTPFGTTSGATVAPTFGASGSGSAPPNIFGASTAVPSTPGAAGAGAGSFTFGSSNAVAFGSNHNQPNPFNQSANAASRSGASMFGSTQSGAFNMGSATRAPQTQRRRLRGRRTLR